MTKPQRALREFNQRNREFYGEPLLPEPEGGFAEPILPPNFHEVEQWFSEATSSQPHRPRRPTIPAESKIARIACLVNEWRALPPQEDGSPSAVAVPAGHRLQVTARDLESELQQVLALAVPTAMPNDPAVTRLVDLWNALRLAAPYIGPPPKQGPQMEPWQVMARALEGPVRSALESAGRKKVSTKEDGPLVKIICSALGALDDKDHNAAAVASCLKRRRHRLKKGVQ
jgi:hypothetical protein